MVQVWSDWITRPPVELVIPPASIFSANVGYRWERDPFEYNGDTEFDYTWPQDDPDTWECAWHLYRMGNNVAPGPLPMWDGTCPVMDQWSPEISAAPYPDYAATIGFGYAANVYPTEDTPTDPGFAFALGGSTPQAALLNVARLRNDYNEDDLYVVHPEAQRIEFEGEDAFDEAHADDEFDYVFYADTVSAQIEIVRDGRPDPDEIARAMLPASYTVVEPDFTDNTWTGVVGLGDHDGNVRWHADGVHGPEAIGGWEPLTTSTDVVSVDVAEARSRTVQYREQERLQFIGWRFGADAPFQLRGPSHIVMWTITESLDPALPSFVNPVHTTNSDLDASGRPPTYAGYGAVVQMRTVLQPCRYRYRYEQTDPVDPPVPGDPITTSITGSNGSARRSFYNARRRH